MNISLLRHAFVLMSVSLAAALFVPLMTLPRLAVSAHTVGMLGAVLLLGLGIIWSLFRLTTLQAAWLKGAWLYSSYVNWLACLFAAAVGAGRMTPVAAAGATGHALAEGLVTVMLVSVALASFLAVGLSLWGLRPGAHEALDAKSRGADRPGSSGAID